MERDVLELRNKAFSDAIKEAILAATREFIKDRITPEINAEMSAQGVSVNVNLEIIDKAGRQIDFTKFESFNYYLKVFGGSNDLLIELEESFRF